MLFLRPHFRDMVIHVNRLLDDRSAQRAMSSHTIALGLLLESSRQSNTRRKFAAWAAIPAFSTAVAGIYGMNFAHMPELSWQYGYFGVLGFIGAGCLGLYAQLQALRLALDKPTMQKPGRGAGLLLSPR